MRHKTLSNIFVEVDSDSAISPNSHLPFLASFPPKYMRMIFAPNAALITRSVEQKHG